MTNVVEIQDRRATATELTLVANRLLTLAVYARSLHRGQRVATLLLGCVDTFERATGG